MYLHVHTQPEGGKDNCVKLWNVSSFEEESKQLQNIKSGW